MKVSAFTTYSSMQSVVCHFRDSSQCKNCLLALNQWPFSPYLFSYLFLRWRDQRETNYGHTDKDIDLTTLMS
jgi:hypothetical protein